MRLAGSAIVLLLPLLGLFQTSPSPPNVLLCIADDWSWPHAGRYGDAAVSTPAFDRLADEGVLFTNAYVSAPSCTPSRAALLTGQWHWRLRESANLWSTLSTDFDVYPELLERAGYFAGFTRKGWGPGKIEPGGRERNPAGEHFESFETFLDAVPRGRPFVFWFGSQDPHRPYEKGVGEQSGIDLSKIEVPRHFPDSRPVRSDVADYLWEVQRFDREVGELLRLLEIRGELENTLVVVTGDNGMPFPRCKATLYDCGVRVPLVVSWGDHLEGGRILDQFVSLTDLAPTFLDLAGVEKDAEMTGFSLRPLLMGDPSAWPRQEILVGKERHVACQEAPDSGGTPMRALRTADYLYIRNYRPDRWPAGTPNFEKAYIPGSWYGDVDNGPTKLFMWENRASSAELADLFELSFAKRPAEELYDLTRDPHQLENVARNPDYDEVRRELSSRLEKELRASEDPRVMGNGSVFDHYPYYGGTPMAPPQVED